MTIIFFENVFFHIWLLPLYILCMLTYFFIQFGRRVSSNHNGSMTCNDHIVIFSFSWLVLLGIPFMYLFTNLFLTFRCVEGLVFLSQIYISSFSCKWAWYVLISYYVGLILISQSLYFSSLLYILEIFIGIVWLMWVFIWMLFSYNLILLLFFLDIVGILVLFLFLHSFAIQRCGTFANNLYWKTFNSSYNYKLYFLQSILFFLWSSTISMLLLFWSCLYIYVFLQTLDINALNFYFYQNLNLIVGYNYLILYLSCCLFFLGICLKTALFPLQLWLISFYKHLPITILIIYILFYYIYFIFFTLVLVYEYLFIFSTIWFAIISVMFCFSFFTMISNIYTLPNFRMFLAFSSVTNIFLVNIYLIVVLHL